MSATIVPYTLADAVLSLATVTAERDAAIAALSTARAEERARIAQGMTEFAAALLAKARDEPDRERAMCEAMAHHLEKYATKLEER